MCHPVTLLTSLTITQTHLHVLSTAGVTFPNAPGSLNSGLNWGVSPTAKLIFQAAALAWPSLDRVEHNMISFGQILLLDVGLFYLKFWGDVCASPLHINFLLSTRSHVCCYKVRKNGFISSDIGYSVVFSCRQVIFTKICFFLSLRKGYFTHFMPATTSAIKGF